MKNDTNKLHKLIFVSAMVSKSSFLIKNSAQQLSTEFGKGFDERELRKMRQFYSCFPIRDALRPELSWTHYRLLLRVEDRNARSFYLSESIEGGWSSRQLDRQISSAYNNGSEQLFASQYQLYLPTETQLKEWVNKQRLFLDLKNNTDEHK